MKSSSKNRGKRTTVLSRTQSWVKTQKKPAGLFFTRTKNQSAALYTRTSGYVAKRPVKSFYIVLGIFLLLIILSNLLRISPVTETRPEQRVKEVEVYSIGTGPTLRFQAQIEKTGVVKITALTGGVVQKINFREGEQVYRGTQLVQISTNYQGGSSLSTQRAISQEQYNTALANYDTQKELIQRQREIADKIDTNADELRGIQEQSLADTREIISLNEDILDAIDAAIQNTPPGPDLTELQGQKATVLSGLSQARQALRTAEYSVSGDKAPAQLSDLQRETTKKQLDVQERVLTMNKEISRLQVQLAQISEAMMFPSSPFTGVIQRVFVKEGEAVNPGTTLVEIAQVKDDPITAVTYVPHEVALKVSTLSESRLHFAGKTYTTTPTYVSAEAVAGNMYAVYYNVPEEYTKYLVEQGYITVDIPVGSADTLAAVSFVPIDAVYQTADAAYVFINSNGVAVSREVELGDVYGEYVQIEKGIASGDSIILSRNILSGDKIKPF